jgi:hypothetical protein
MKTTYKQTLFAGALLAAMAFTTTIARAQDPLPSWNDGAAKKSIIDFVEKVTKEGSPDFVPPNERIATFDNDGTLWCEKPMPVQLFFVVDRVKALAPSPLAQAQDAISPPTLPEGPSKTATPTPAPEKPSLEILAGAPVHQKPVPAPEETPSARELATPAVKEKEKTRVKTHATPEASAEPPVAYDVLVLRKS